MEPLDNFMALVNQQMLPSESEIRMHGGTPIFPIPLFYFILVKMSKTIGIDRACQCGDFGLFFFIENQYFPATFFVYFPDFSCLIILVKIDVKSHPFEEFIVNLASWTP